MRIVYVSWEYPPHYGGGIGTFVHAISGILAERGHEVTVITVAPGTHPVREQVGKVNVVRLPHVGGTGADPMASLRSWQGRSDAVADLLTRMVDAGSVDLIEFADYRGEGATFLTGRPSGERPVCVVKLHTSLVVLNKYNPSKIRYRVLEAYENEAILAADRVASPSRVLAEEMRQALPQLTNVDISPYPTDPRFLSHDLTHAPAEADEILYVGRLEERKGVETLVQAAVRLFDACPTVRLVMVGGDTDAGPKRPSLKKHLLDLLPKRCHHRLDMPGAIPREQLIERYLRARFCVFPSHFENFPNTCLEAMSLGRCVIGTDNSGMAEMIEHGISGVIVKAADVDALTDAMIRLYRMPEAERHGMGRAARQRIIDQYHPDVIAVEVERLYGGYIQAHACKLPTPAIRMTSPARVAVVIPCYNHGKFIAETLDSVRAQTYPHVECVVVDDGSTDPETIDALQRVEADGIRVIRQKNQGLSAARNTGVRATDAPFYVPLDADDRIAPDFIEKLLPPLLNDSGVGYCYSHVSFFGAASGVWQCPDYDPRKLLVENLSVATAVVRRAAFDLVGGYSRDMVHGFEDWDLWLALLATGYTGRCVAEPLFFYRKHAKGSSMLDHTQQHRAEMIRVMIEHHRSLFASLLSVSMSQKDSMFFRAHMEAWHLREAIARGTPTPANAGQASLGHAGTGNPPTTIDDDLYQTLMAQAQVEYIENSGTWRAIERLKRNPLYRAVARLRFGPNWDAVDPNEDPRQRLAHIRSSRFYRTLQAIKRTSLYQWHARRKYGPDFVLPFSGPDAASLSSPTVHPARSRTG